MAILAFQKTDKVLMLEEDSRFGKFELRPLEPGLGITVGNALRRILLSSLDGFAINTIKIEGVEHEFASVPLSLIHIYIRQFGISRIQFREMASNGLIPGVKKASW